MTLRVTKKMKFSIQELELNWWNFLAKIAKKILDSRFLFRDPRSDSVLLNFVLGSLKLLRTFFKIVTLVDS